MKKIIVVGAGGHALIVKDIIMKSNYEIYGYIDKENKTNKNLNVIGNDNMLSEIRSQGITCAAIGIGHVGNYELRRRVLDNLKKLHFELPVLIHPSANVETNIPLGDATMVGIGCIVNPFAKIGESCILNSGSIIEHDAVINDNVHIAPGAIVLGGAIIGEDTFVGAGSTILQGIRIGKRCIVGAGSVVLNDVPDDQIVVGNPARKLKKR